MSDFTTLPEMTHHFAQTRPDTTALFFEGRTTTYRSFERHTNQVANGLIARGFRASEHILYLGKNSDLYFELLFGCAKARLVATPVNWRLALREIARIVRDCEAPVLFFGREFVEAARSLMTECPCLRTLVAMETEEPGIDQFTAWRDRQPSAPPPVAVTKDDIAIQLYTSGTTGRSKGAMIRHRNLLEPMDAMKESPDHDWNRWNSDDVSLISMPVGHIAATNWAVMTLYNGAMAVVAREYDPHAIMDFIERDRVSKMALVPSALQFLLRDPRAGTADFSRLKYIVYGASPIPPELMREAMEVIGCKFVQGYGMTETAGAVSILGPEDHQLPPTPRMRSAGKPLPGVEVAILDESGRHLPAGQIGEIAIRSSGNMAGYWNLPQETAATIDSEGWLRTGDAGELDEDGYIYIRDRVTEMIITGGENVYPAEVENAIFGHPLVDDVAVIGLPDEKWGEAVVAVIVPKNGAIIDPRDIIAHARKQIAGFKSPKRVEFVTALPRNASGKILRRELRALFSPR